MDNDIKQMTCKCCGAPLKHSFDGWYCEYCGTRYIGGDTGPRSLKIVTEPARVEHFVTQMAIPEFAVMHDPDGVGQHAMRYLAQEMAEGLAQHMRYEVRRDFMTNDYIIRGDIGVVMPRGRYGILEWGNADD